MKSEYKVGLNKHLGDAGMAFTKPGNISEFLQMPSHENLPIEVRRYLSGKESIPWDTAIDFK